MKFFSEYFTVKQSVLCLFSFGSIMRWADSLVYVRKSLLSS